MRVAGAYRWPGPVHEGNGTWWSVIDKRATEEQVNALFTILGGQEQEPTTGFAIYGSTITNEPDPVFTDIEFEWDLENRIGRFAMENVLGATIEPINNPVTGADHHAHIHLREGFEVREAEMANASFWRKGEHDGKYTAISYVTYGPHGIIDQGSTACTTGRRATGESRLGLHQAL